MLGQPFIVVLRLVVRSFGLFAGIGQPLRDDARTGTRPIRRRVRRA